MYACKNRLTLAQRIKKKRDPERERERDGWQCVYSFALTFFYSIRDAREPIEKARNKLKKYERRTITFLSYSMTMKMDLCEYYNDKFG